LGILIVHPCKNIYGGAEEVVVALDNWLASKGYKPINLLKDPPTEMLYKLRGEVRLARTYSDFWSMSHIPGYEAVVAFNFPAPLAVFPKKTPMVWYVNEPPELFTNLFRKPLERLNRWWVRHPHIATAVATSFDRDRFESIYGLTPAVIPYGIDYDWWSAPTSSHEWPLPKGSINLLQVGTITPHKNQLWSLYVLKHLDRLHPTTLTFIGKVTDDKYFQRLLKLIDEWRLGYKIQFLGHRSLEQVRWAYNNYDILLHPVTKAGGWLVPFEATCAGTPVITVPEFQESWRFENVFSSPEQAARCCIALKSTHDEALREIIKKDFTWDKYCKNVVKLLEGLQIANSNV